MLSASKTIDDIKIKIIKDYTYYGYSDYTKLDDALKGAVSEARLSELIPVIGQAYYESIASKDKIGLSIREECIYWSEIFFAISKFLGKRALSDNQSSMGDSESITVEGYSRSVSGGVTGKESTALSFYYEGLHYLSLAGFKTLQIKRTSNIISGDC